MKKFLLSLFAICTLAIANAETYTHTFAQGDLTTNAETVSLSGIEWTTTEATAIGWNNTKGIEIGVKNNGTMFYSLSTSAFANLKIRSVTVKCSRISSSDVKMKITVNGQPSEEFTPGTSDTDCTFDCEDTKGNISIEWNASTHRAYYIKSITIDYVPNNINVPTPEFKTPIAIYADKVMVKAICEDAEAIIYYTLDGTDPVYEEWEDSTSSTKSAKYPEMDFDLTATTTIKMIAVRTDGEAVFKSGIAEQTYIVSRTMPYITANEIISGNKYAMTAADSAATYNYNNEAQGLLPTKTATKVNGKYSNSVEAAGFTFTATNGGYTIQDELGRYISHTGAEATFSYTAEIPATGAVWSIATDDNGYATISNNGYVICYTASSATFGCYPADQLTDEHTLPQLYMQREYPQYTITPESGSSMDKLESITIYCAEGIAATTDTVYDSDNNMIVRDLKIEASGFKTEFTISQPDNNTLVFTANEPIVSHNNYDLSINIVGGDIIICPDAMKMSLPIPVRHGLRTMVKYTINGDAEAATIEEVIPANGSTVEKLSHFIFTFSYFADHVRYPEHSPKLYLEGSEELIAVDKTLTKEDGKQIGMQQAALKTTEPVTANGTYILEIPTGYFVDGNGLAVEGIILRYIVDSAASIEEIVANDEGCWVVYNTGGVKVLDTKEANKIKELPSGVYIINGIKAVIK